MSSETPYFSPAYEYEIDPEFRPSYVNVEKDVPSLPVEPGIVVRPVLGKRLNISFIYFEPRAVAPVHQHREEQIGTVLGDPSSLSLPGKGVLSTEAMSTSFHPMFPTEPSPARRDVSPSMSSRLRGKASESWWREGATKGRRIRHEHPCGSRRDSAAVRGADDCPCRGRMPSRSDLGALCAGALAGCRIWQSPCWACASCSTSWQRRYLPGSIGRICTWRRVGRRQWRTTRRSVRRRSGGSGGSGCWAGGTRDLGAPSGYG